MCAAQNTPDIDHYVSIQRGYTKEYNPDNHTDTDNPDNDRD